MAAYMKPHYMLNTASGRTSVLIRLTLAHLRLKDDASSSHYHWSSHWVPRPSYDQPLQWCIGMDTITCTCRTLEHTSGLCTCFQEISTRLKSIHYHVYTCTYRYINTTIMCVIRVHTNEDLDTLSEFCHLKLCILFIWNNPLYMHVQATVGTHK